MNKLKCNLSLINSVSAKHMWWRVFQTFLLTFKYQ